VLCSFSPFFILVSPEVAGGGNVFPKVWGSVSCGCLRVCMSVKAREVASFVFPLFLTQFFDSEIISVDKKMMMMNNNNNNHNEESEFEPVYASEPPTAQPLMVGIPLDAPVTCTGCKGSMPFEQVPLEMRFNVIMRALNAVLKCEGCLSKGDAPAQPQEVTKLRGAKNRVGSVKEISAWVKRVTGCTAYEATRVAPDLQNTFDVHEVRATEFGIAVIDAASVKQMESHGGVTISPPSKNGNRYVLVDDRFIGTLREDYLRFLKAEKDCNAIIINQFRARAEETKAKTKTKLMESIAAAHVDPYVEAQHMEVQHVEEDQRMDKKRGRSEDDNSSFFDAVPSRALSAAPPRAPLSDLSFFINLVSEEEDKEEEEPKHKASKQREPAVTPTKDLLREKFGLSTKDAKSVIASLKNNEDSWTVVYIKSQGKGVTTLCAPYNTVIAPCVTEGLIPDEHVVSSFCANKKEIEKGTQKGIAVFFDLDRKLHAQIEKLADISTEALSRILKPKDILETFDLPLEIELSEVEERDFAPAPVDLAPPTAFTKEDCDDIVFDTRSELGSQIEQCRNIQVVRHDDGVSTVTIINSSSITKDYNTRSVSFKEACDFGTLNAMTKEEVSDMILRLVYDVVYMSDEWHTMPFLEPMPEANWNINN